MSESIDLGSGSNSGSTAELTTVRYAIDGRISRFTVRAFASGMLSAFGHSPTIAIRDFVGEAQFNPDKLESASLHVTVKTASLTVTDDISDKDRREIEREMQDGVLESVKYPEIRLRLLPGFGEQSGKWAILDHIARKSDFAWCDPRSDDSGARGRYR